MLGELEMGVAVAGGSRGQLFTGPPQRLLVSRSVAQVGGAAPLLTVVEHAGDTSTAGSTASRTAAATPLSIESPERPRDGSDRTK